MNNGKNIDDDNFKLNIDKDEDDDEEIVNNSEINENKAIKFVPLAPKIKASFPRFKPMISLFRKHKRSFDSSNSSDSFKKSKKKRPKQLTTFQKEYIESQKENFEKNYQILKEDFKLIEEYEKKVFKDTNLDIMFIMDLTGSMGTWLNEAKKSVKNITEEILDNNPGSKIRISFIGYRDFMDAKQKRIYHSKEFTEDINDFNKFLSRLDCYGGGDEPEDVVGALKVGLDMDWQSNAKYAVLVCDAPCHGKKYHDISYDKFEDGDPDGTLLEDVMKKFYEKGITFYCIEIDKNTSKMFNIMREVYNDNNKFHVEKLGNSVNQFSFFVSFSASVLLGNTKYNKITFAEILSNYRNEIIEKIISKYMNKSNINYSNNKINNNNCITVQLINEIDNLNLGDKDKKLLDFINRMSTLCSDKNR